MATNLDDIKTHAAATLRLSPSERSKLSHEELAVESVAMHGETLETRLMGAYDALSKLSAEERALILKATAPKGSMETVRRYIERGVRSLSRVLMPQARRDDAAGKPNPIRLAA